jgi:hypothetical protein
MFKKNVYFLSGSYTAWLCCLVLHGVLVCLRSLRALLKKKSFFYFCAGKQAKRSSAHMDDGFMFKDLVEPVLGNSQAPAMTWRDVFIPSVYKKRTRGEAEDELVLTCVDDAIPKRLAAGNLMWFKFKGKPLTSEILKTKV